MKIYTRGANDATSDVEWYESAFITKVDGSG
jgi:hypothetical protein